MIWTRSLLIWSQTRYHCATESGWVLNFTLLDLNCRFDQSDFCQGWGDGFNCSTWKTRENIKLQKRNKLLRKESTNVFRQKWGHHFWMNKPLGSSVRCGRDGIVSTIFYTYTLFGKSRSVFSCSSRLKTARFLSGASPHRWCIKGNTLQVLMLSLSHTHTEFLPLASSIHRSLHFINFF